MATGQPDQELEKEGYRSFLLRLWQVDAQKTHGWRFSLEDPLTGERIGFANIADLMTYLLREICKENNHDATM